MAGLYQTRRCDGCGEVKRVAGARGPRGRVKRFCQTCLPEHDAGKPSPLELLKQALPHVPAELAEQISECIPSS